MNNNDLTMHHVGVAVKNIQEAIPLYERLFNYRLLEQPVHDPIQKVSVCFLGRDKNEQILTELIEPAAEDSPIGRFLSKGIGAYHVCYETDNIEESLEKIRENKCIVISGPTPAVAFNGRPIAWFMTPTRQLIELLQR